MRTDRGRGPTYAGASWLFGRGLGFTFFVAFVSIHVQVDGLFGEHGIVPASEWFDEFVARGGRFPDCPTLAFLFGADDAGLARICLIGELASTAVMLGVLPGPCVLLATLAYLSLHQLGAPFLSFQWDTLLIESGFLATGVLPWRPFDDPRRALSPPAFARWAVYALVFRLMFLSGVVKLGSGDPSWRDGTALSYHFYTQPLPNPVAYLLAGLPPWTHRLETLVTLVIEAGVPWLLPMALALAATGAVLREGASAGAERVDGWAVLLLRTVFIVFASLMLAISLSGNYGFFNLLTLVLCLPLLDDACLRQLTPRRLASWWSDAVRRPRRWESITRLVQCSALIFVWYLGGVSLALGLGAGPSVPRVVTEDVARVAPFRITNGYGLFAVMTKSRREIHLEGSLDGERWRRYVFRDKPDDPARALPVVGLHMPRLDWQMWFAALGSLRDNPWLVRLMARLLEAEPSVLALFESDPFDGARPRFVRATIDDYHFTSWSEPGFWRVEPLGAYSPTLALVDGELVVVR